jgi:hypothetical protein
MQKFLRPVGFASDVCLPDVPGNNENVDSQPLRERERERERE